MKTALEILKNRSLLIECDKTCECHTHLVIQAMEDYATQARISENKRYNSKVILRILAEQDELGLQQIFNERIKELA